MNEFLHSASFVIMLSGDNTPICAYYLVNKPEFIVGSAKDCDACLLFSNEISHHHAKITYQDDEYVICDLQSTNGTLLNGQPLIPMQSYPLNIGDRLSFSTFSFLVESIRL